MTAKKICFPDFDEIKPTKEMVNQASRLNEGPILIIYKDGTAIRMETRDGRNPYVWRGGKWHPMTPHWGKLR